MFQGLRLNLTGKFFLVSLIVYVFVLCGSAAFFHHGLTQYLDEVMQEVCLVSLRAVKEGSNAILVLREPPQHMHIRGSLLSPTMSIFDRNGKLTESFGKGSQELVKSGMEVTVDGINLRTFSRPIMQDKDVVGYLQVQLDTSPRERAIAEYLEALVLTAPLLLLALALAGYYFASRAIKPVEESFSLLKRFMSDAGHELKTPIAVIHASCDNLAADLAENKSATERVDVISRSADRMQRLVADLLLLTKSEQASLTLKMIPMRFDMLLREVLGEFSDLFEEKGIELNADSIQSARISGDRDSLHRMLANLLENALNYTEPGGKVTVSLTTSANLLALKVSDTGVGIPLECQDKIFERFYRVDESRTRAKGGSGLGLAIVKAISESHKGQVRLESEPGKGSTFTITIPLVSQSTIFRLKKAEE